MAWLVDGSNVLGAQGADLHAIDAKRELTRLLATFGRARRVRLICFFDGQEPANFGRHLGGVTVVFSGRQTADDLIAEQAAKARDAKVVTSDRGLAARVASRRVEVIDARRFLRELAAVRPEAEAGSENDWLEWFADPKNQGKF